MTDDFLSFSKDAAKTLGLSEAVLLETIKKITDSQNLDVLNLEVIVNETIFWEEEKVKSLLVSLDLKGLIIFNKESQKISLVSFGNRAVDLVNRNSMFSERKETLIGKGWEPDVSLIDQANEYGISKSFVLSQVDEFVYLHREKSDSNHSWGIKFLRYVIKKWRKQEISDFKESKKKLINQNWWPDEEAQEILYKAGVKEEFIINEVPEFILYWSERGEASDTWNTKFIAQVRRQWAKTQHLIHNSETPRPIQDNWKPSEDFYEVLALTEIDRKFADSTLKEFIFYWKETGQAHNSWNSKFIQHVKYQWQKHLRYSKPELVDEMEKRILSSWEIKPNNQTKKNDSVSKKEIQSKLENLKKKHRI